MPYKSKAQMRLFHSQLPELAPHWDAATKDFKKLPEHVKNKSRPGKARKK